MNTIKKYFDSIGGYDMKAHVTICKCGEGLLYDGLCESMPIKLMKQELLSAVKLINGGTTWYKFTLIEEPEEPEEPKITLELTKYEALMLNWLVTHGASVAREQRANGTGEINCDTLNHIIAFNFEMFNQINEKVAEIEEGC